ncbi:MAG: branched-chain-amino-acid transaminase, partial [Candidatus Sumerlaeaceae bacterium]|nr:branched-chain-amino-acid transaminase [Candidatus Sumerlaeaceae bacterium]
MQIWLDGQLCDKAEARVSVFDHGLLYGDGVFEGLRVYDGCVFRLKQHLDRLYDSARVVMIEIPYTRDQITQAICDTVRANGLRNCYVRLVVTRGTGDLGLNPANCPRPTVFIIAAPISLYPPEVYTRGLEIVTVPSQRFHVASWNPRVKSLNYLNNIMAKIEGQTAGALEALMLDHNGYVVECTADNVFIVRGGVLFTPPAYLGALRGITQAAVIDLATGFGWTVRHEPFTRYEVFTADEMFLTGTAAEVV